MRLRGSGRVSCCILLAAGPSRRFGAQKLLARVGGKRLIDLSLEPLVKGGCSRILVIASDEMVARAAGGFRVVRIRDPGEDMMESIRAGIRACDEADAYLIQLGDMPLVPPEYVRILIEAVETGVFSYAQPIEARTRKKGHPVALSRKLAEEALRSKKGETLRDVLGRHLYEGAWIPAGDWCIFDVDTRGDLEDLLNRLRV